MDNASRLIADITGCTAAQTQVVVAALIDGGWSPPTDSPSVSAGTAPAVTARSLDDRPVGRVLAVHTDGACSGNPGPGGWAVVFSVDGIVVDAFYGGEPHTTNNRLELTAVREAIRRAPADAALEIMTDSQNVVGWLAGGWKHNDPTIAALCREVDGLRAQRTVEQGGAVSFRHVRGHNADELNELPDRLAREALKRL
jgi:ribonuclease HI